MLLLLSSGARPRYRDDIIRCLALPLNGELQFRYDKRWVEDDLIAEISNGTFPSGERALVLYLSADMAARKVDIVPCRFVEIRAAELVGTSCILTLRAQEFVTDVIDTTVEIKRVSAGVLPKWSSSLGGDTPRLEGKFFIRSTGDVSRMAGTELAHFEATVAALAAYADFSKDGGTIFYNLKRIVDLTTDTQAFVSNRDGSFRLNGGHRYEMEVYCYAIITADTPVARLFAESDLKSLEFPFGNSRVIDSRYDLKKFRFRIASQVSAVSTALRLRIIPENDSLVERADILVPATFAGSPFLAVLRIGLMGLGLSIPAMIAGWDKMNLGVGLLILAAGFGAATGVVLTRLKDGDTPESVG